MSETGRRCSCPVLYVSLTVELCAPAHSLNDSFESQLAQEMDALDHIPEESVGSGCSGSGSGSGSVGLPGADLLYTWRDHVSCEDLLEFAADRPNVRRTRGPAHGAESDEVSRGLPAMCPGLGVWRGRN